MDISPNEEYIAKDQGALFDSNMKKWYFTDSEENTKFEEFISQHRNQSRMTFEKLSDEQQKLIILAKEGKNVLVDACIGSGKTSTIQVLCEELPLKKILYLTYNRLLKIDAKGKIQGRNAFVTNYHGFAYHVLITSKIPISGVSDLIQTLIANKEKIRIGRYNLLLIDEYQDIDEEIAEMLELIKKENENIQIIAVGDMKQKIYDKTSLDVSEFIYSFLGEHKLLNFTKCFRLNEEFANKLGNIWKKRIVGVNNECEVKIMDFDQTEKFLSEQRPSDILCLGKRTNSMSRLLNNLEEKYKDIFNKETVYASIYDEDRSHRNLTDKVAIFTTFDSSKGLERKICVIFDYTEKYWKNRASQSDTRYEILRNIFCVAASRGKQMIIFVNEPGSPFLSDDTIGTPFIDNGLQYTYIMSDMFAFKRTYDVEKCFKLLKIERDETAEIDEIDVKSVDGTIDLSPCIGILQEASFFDKYSIDDNIDFYCKNKKTKRKVGIRSNLEEKVLYYVSLETKQNRYLNQVSIPFVGKNTLKIIHDRMSEVFTHEEKVQVPCSFPFLNDGFEQECAGFCDVLKDDVVWELKFTSELSHEHYLQCAGYMIALGKYKGVLWNVRTNERFFITIPDRAEFMTSVIKTITKGRANNIVYYVHP